MKVRQVLLTRQAGENEPVHWYTWIPAELAKAGNEVQDRYGRTWEVFSAYSLVDEREGVSAWKLVNA